MVMVHFVSAGTEGESTVQSVQAKVGLSVMQAAVAAGVRGIAADCGGMLTCATCHVFVDAAWLDRLVPPDEDEQSMLDFTAAPREANSRLSCQLVLTESLDGLTVRLPVSQY